MQVERTIWLTSPDNLKGIDFNDPESIINASYLYNLTSPMEKQGWVKLGMATVNFHSMTAYNTAAVQAAAQIDEAIKGLQAETEGKINEFLRVKQELLCLEAPSHD